MMTLHDYIADRGRRDLLVRALGTSPATLYQYTIAFRRPSPARALAIERATGSAVPRWQLRPDVWPPPLPERADAT